MTKASRIERAAADGGDHLDATVRAINARLGTDFTVVKRFDSRVNSGAAIVAGSAGQRVLKLIRRGHSIEAQRNAAMVTAALRPKGYPVPEYERVEPLGDTGYVLMSVLPGRPGDFASHGPALIPRILELNRLQYDSAVLPTRWPGEIVDGVTHGGDGYCFPEEMRLHSRTASELLATLQRLAIEHAGAPTQRDGVVHKDHNPGNLLAIEAVLTGVVDWEDTCSGDPAYDIAYLWFCTFQFAECREMLWRHLVNTVDPRTIALCLAHVICGFVSGAMKRQKPATVERHLAAADSALRDLRRLGLPVRGLDG